MNIKKLFISLIGVCLLVAGLFLIQSLLVPKFVHGIVEGSLIEEYYEEKSKDHDVIFIGDCEVYENFSPITMWEEYGITSYIRGSAQQLIWQSYYLLEETLKYEKPEVVVFNVLSMKYDEPQKEAYNRLTLDGMKLSPTKLKAINASMMEDENVIDYLFPILRYHSRWNELEKQDFQYMFDKEKLFHNGYYMRVDVRAAGTIPKPRALADYNFGENAYYYLDRIRELTEEHGIELVLIKAPTIYPHWYDQWDEQMEEYAEKHDLAYINFLNHTDEIGIDYNVDTYDGGLHLNVTGAEKLAKYFGKFLVDNYQLEDHRNNEKLAQIWNEKSEFYYAMKEDQYKELAEYGYLKRYSVNDQ